VSNKEISRLSRLIAILTQLQSKRLVTATEIAEKFDISVRTVYRDVRTLEQAGVPILTEEGKGYSIMDGYKLPPVAFTENEANAFITAEKLVLLNRDTSLINNYVDGVTKIKAVLRSTAKEHVVLLSERVAFEQTSAIEATSNYLSAIQVALTNFNVIKIEYQSNNGEATTRLVEPFAVINDVGKSWYLVAWCRLRKDYRLFRFDRIKKMSVTDSKFPPHKMTLPEYLENYKNKFRHP
jgi:predicted DNA-binding transcriptional regulator YafY